VRASLDHEGRATEATVPAVTRLVEDFAADVRSVNKAQAAQGDSEKLRVFE